MRSLRPRCGGSRRFGPRSAATSGASCHQLPASKAAGMDLGEVVVLDVDATLIPAHSEKDQAAATFKHGFGLHPIGVWCGGVRSFV
jgi:hypothetical protein